MFFFFFKLSIDQINDELINWSNAICHTGASLFLADSIEILTNLNILKWFFFCFFVLLKTSCIEHCEDAQVTDAFLETRQSFYIERIVRAMHWRDRMKDIDANVNVSRQRRAKNYENTKFIKE